MFLSKAWLTMTFCSKIGQLVALAHRGVARTHRAVQEFQCRDRSAAASGPAMASADEERLLAGDKHPTMLAISSYF